MVKRAKLNKRRHLKESQRTKIINNDGIFSLAEKMDIIAARMLFIPKFDHYKKQNALPLHNASKKCEFSVFPTVCR